MLLSRAYTTQMSLSVPDVEKRIAEKAKESFESLMSEIKMAMEYLNLIYIPFSTREVVDSNEVVENRDILRKYRDQIKTKFEAVIDTAHKGLSLMGEFSVDSSVEELMNSFVASIKELEKQVNYLLSIFSNLNSPDFKDSLINSINSIKIQASQLKQLINDRVLEHIDTNILAKNWESLVNDKFQGKMESKTPLVIELYKERQKALNS